MDTALSIHLIKIAIYLIAFLFSSLGTSAVLWNSILNPKKPREALLFYFLVTLALTYLVGSLFIAFLGIELWRSRLVFLGIFKKRKNNHLL